jgi:hypothetical protein
MKSFIKLVAVIMAAAVLCCSGKVAREADEPVKASPGDEETHTLQQAGEVPALHSAEDEGATPEEEQAEDNVLHEEKETGEAPAEPETQTSTEHAAGPPGEANNFVLYVSNQSFANDPVDIKIYIDGELIVDQDFYVENQHNWKMFQLTLSKGKHKLKVTSDKGKAGLKKKFEVTGMHWAVVDYWFYPKTHYMPTPKKFTFTISDKPIIFM